VNIILFAKYARVPAAILSWISCSIKLSSFAIDQRYLNALVFLQKNPSLIYNLSDTHPVYTSCMVQQSLVGKCTLIIDASLTHLRDSPTQRPLPGNIQYLQGTDIHIPGGIRTRNPKKLTAADPHLKQRGHQDRPRLHNPMLYFKCNE
jgi:hypothetical protein